MKAPRYNFQHQHFEVVPKADPEPTPIKIFGGTLLVSTDDESDNTERLCALMQVDAGEFKLMCLGTANRISDTIITSDELPLSLGNNLFRKDENPGSDIAYRILTTEETIQLVHPNT